MMPGRILVGATAGALFVGGARRAELGRKVQNKVGRLLKAGRFTQRRFSSNGTRGSAMAAKGNVKWRLFSLQSLREPYLFTTRNAKKDGFRRGERGNPSFSKKGMRPFANKKIRCLLVLVNQGAG
jgi:hypothetical protein